MDEAAFERQLQHLLSHRAEPLSGWVLQMALNLNAETGYPIVVSLHKATDFRRSVVIAVLTVKSPTEIRAAFDAADQRQTMHHLFHDDIRSVLRKVFGSMPGLATALGKMGGDAFEDPGHYDVLLTLLTPGAIEDQRQRALALRHASDVNSDLVTALARLDRELVHPILAKLFDGEATAETANAILRYVQGMSSTPITTDDLIQVSKGARSMRFQLWAAKLMARKADMLPSGPLEDHLGFLPLNDATQFAAIGQRFRNCLSSHVLRAAMGRAAFYLVKDNPDLIVELVQYRMAGKTIWVLQDIHGYDNRPVSLRHRRDVVDLLRLRGITELAPGYDARMTLTLGADRKQGLNSLNISYPQGCRGVSPLDAAQYAIQVLLKRSRKNWLVMGDPVAQLSDGFYVSAQFRTPLVSGRTRGSVGKDAEKVRVPKPVLMPFCQHAFPERKL